MTKDQTWGYLNSPCSPSEWARFFPTGARQSPIDISTHSDLKSTCCKHSTQNQDELMSYQQLSEHLQTAARIRSSEGEVGRHHHHHQRTHHHHHHHQQNLLLNNQMHHHRTHLDSAGDELDADASSSATSEASPNSNSSSNAASPISGEHPDLIKARRSNDNNNNNNDFNYEIGSKSNHITSISSNEITKKTHHSRQNTRHCVSKRKLFLGYPRYLDQIKLCNTGHNWQVDLPPEVSHNTLLCGPSFGDREYRLAQFHCHWGSRDDCGSEHSLNGHKFAAEIHFVHWNCTDFSSFEEAAKQRHGLAVLAVLLQAIDGEQNRNKHLEKICQALEAVQAPNSSLKYNARLDMKKLFPENRWQYATYEGSLTTPPLSEVVDWLVFVNPIQCSSEQVKRFRGLECNSSHSRHGDSTEPLLTNCRPVQPHCERLITLWSHH